MVQPWWVNATRISCGRSDLGLGGQHHQHDDRRRHLRGAESTPGSLGSYAPLAFVAALIGIGAVAICLAEGGGRVPTSGRIYGYIEAPLGPLSGYVMGTLLCMELTVSQLRFEQARRK